MSKEIFEKRFGKDRGVKIWGLLSVNGWIQNQKGNDKKAIVQPKEKRKKIVFICFILMFFLVELLLSSCIKLVLQIR